MSSQTRSTAPGAGDAGQPLPETLRLRGRGVVTLPKKLREKYDLGEGDAFRLVDLGGVFAITPMRPMVPELSREIERMRTEAGVSTEQLLEGLRSERRRSYAERYAGDMKKFAEEAFEVYQGEARRWRLFRPGGSGEVLATAPETYPDRASAEEALRLFKERAENSRIETTSDDAGLFEWRLLAAKSGDVLAVGSGPDAPDYASAEEARRAALGAQRVAAAARGLRGQE